MSTIIAILEVIIGFFGLFRPKARKVKRQKIADDLWEEIHEITKDIREITVELVGAMAVGDDNEWDRLDELRAQYTEDRADLIRRKSHYTKGQAS